MLYKKFEASSLFDWFFSSCYFKFLFLNYVSTLIPSSADVHVSDLIHFYLEFSRDRTFGTTFFSERGSLLKSTPRYLSN